MQFIIAIYVRACENIYNSYRRHMINNGKWIVFAHLVFHAWPREFSLEKSFFYHSFVRKTCETRRSCWTLKLQQFSREQLWINCIPQEVVDIRYLNEPTLGWLGNVIFCWMGSKLASQNSRVCVLKLYLNVYITQKNILLLQLKL